MQPSAARHKTDDPAAIDTLAGDVQYYLTLTPRQLPSRYFYDPLGSALFEAVGDSVLVGTDLVKPERDLLLAYDDPLGVTAAFNRNLLVRINRQLGADFDVSAFRHQALWNAAESRVEMHLVASRAQRVRIPGASLDVAFDAGETIWT